MARKVITPPLGTQSILRFAGSFSSSSCSLQCSTPVFKCRLLVWQLLLDPCTLALKEEHLDLDSGCTSSTVPSHPVLSSCLNLPACDQSPQPAALSKDLLVPSSGGVWGCLSMRKKGLDKPLCSSGYLLSPGFGYLNHENPENTGECMVPGKWSSRLNSLCCFPVWV